jgi:hypothetical protein
VLVNDGTTPAEDIDINMQFPNGFRLLEGNQLPDPPDSPKPPVEPRTIMEKRAELIKFSYPMVSSPNFGSINHSNPVEPLANVSSPTIKPTNSYEVCIHVQKVKHNMQAKLDPLFVVFDSYESSNSFMINYKILADNISHEVSGSLNVIIDKQGI